MPVRLAAPQHRDYRYMLKLQRERADKAEAAASEFAQVLQHLARERQIDHLERTVLIAAAFAKHVSFVPRS